MKCTDWIPKEVAVRNRKDVATLTMVAARPKKQIQSLTSDKKDIEAEASSTRQYITMKW